MWYLSVNNEFSININASLELNEFSININILLELNEFSININILLEFHEFAINSRQFFTSMGTVSYKTVVRQWFNYNTVIDLSIFSIQNGKEC